MSSTHSEFLVWFFRKIILGPFEVLFGAFDRMHKLINMIEAFWAYKPR